MDDEAWTYDVGEEEFRHEVIAASSECSVIVDFWAPWCAPCRVLGPALEQIVRSYEGKVRLARVNVDENPQLAAEWGIQGIPAVKIFRGGGVVAEFVGALPEAELKRKIADAIPTRADELVGEGDRLAAEGKGGEAEGDFAYCWWGWGRMYTCSTYR